jgi:hypothetical protein
MAALDKRPCNCIHLEPKIRSAVKLGRIVGTAQVAGDVFSSFGGTGNFVSGLYSIVESHEYVSVACFPMRVEFYAKYIR